MWSFLNISFKYRCVVRIGFPKTAHDQKWIRGRGQQWQKTTTITMKVPRGSEKGKSSNDDGHGHGQKKRRPSTYVEGKIWKMKKTHQIAKQCPFWYRIRNLREIPHRPAFFILKSEQQMMVLRPNYFCVLFLTIFFKVKRQKLIQI